MKTKDIILSSILFLACAIFTSDVVDYQLTGNHLLSMSSPSQHTASVDNTECTNSPVPSRDKTTDPQLRTLPAFEKACKSSFASDMMIFTNMPISVDNANVQADKMASRLKEFANQKITPIVIAEPDSDWGLIDFSEFASGYYDQWISAYFSRLKQDGINDTTLGLWIPFPEPQQPTWNNNGNPDDFANSVNRYFTSLRSIFPKGQTGILLDSQAGSDNSSQQVLAYTRLVNNSLVDVAGLQGFPWDPSDSTDSRQPITSASEFAPASLLSQIARSLGTKNVLYNVGTYRQKKTDNGGDLAIPLAQRTSSMKSIFSEAEKSKLAGMNVTVNIFAQNKFDMKEGIDWSYWSDGNYSTSQQTPLFVDLVHSLKENGINVSIYDSQD